MSLGSRGAGAEERARSTSVRSHAAPSSSTHWPSSLLDACGVLLAIAYAVPSLKYGFGRDQSIFHYIGREWLEGTLPYHDAFDTKPPGIYLLHSVLIGLFGSGISVIRWA